MKRNIKYKFDVVIIVIFIASLVLPLVFSNKRGGAASQVENRMLAKFPSILTSDGKIDYKGFRNGLESWVNDNAGFRDKISTLNNKINLDVFNATNKDELVGKDKWLYLMPEGNIKRVQNVNQLNDQQVSYLKQRYKDITAYFKSNNTAFTIMTFPYKTDIYPEYLPDTILKINKESSLDIMKKNFENNTDFDFYIPLNELLQAKNDKVIYSKAADNSHWNNYGAFIGYSQLMKQAKKYIPSVKILTEQDFNITPYIRETYRAGRLYTTETDYKFELRTLATAVSDKTFFDKIGYTSHDPWKSYNYYKNKNSKLPKAIIVGDSYVWMFMLDKIAESFSELVFIHQLDLSNLNSLYSIIKPDIIINAGLIETMQGIASYTIPQKISLPVNIKSAGNAPFHWLDYVNQYVVSSRDIKVDPNSENITLEGWALDGLVEGTASEVVVEVGGELNAADYGKDRDTVVKSFNKNQYLKSGYTINLDTKKVLQAGGFTIHIISKDGTYQYEPQKWNVTSYTK